MKTILDIFWQTAHNIKENSSPYDSIRSSLHPLNNPWHPLRNPYHPLKNPYHSVNNPYNLHRGKQQAQILQQLINQYLI